MANKLLSYSGITAKVKAMQSDLLKNEDYQKISNMESIIDFINYLKTNSTYNTALKGYEETNLHRGQIEHLISNSLYESYSRIYLFSNQEQRRTLTFLSLRFEVNIIKSCLQHIFNPEYTYQGSGFDSIFSKKHSINLEQLSTSKTIDEYISILKNTEYYDCLRAIQNSSNATLFDYEMQLDIYYFKKAWKLKEKYLHGDNKKAYTEVLGKKIDLLNVLWIYRCKKYYDIDPTQIYSYIIPVNFKLKKKEITSLIEANSIEELLNIFNKTYYVRTYGMEETTSFERFYKNLMLKIYNLNKQKYPHSMAPVQQFLFQKETEIDNLTTILECIRYKLTSSEILNYVQ